MSKNHYVPRTPPPVSPPQKHKGVDVQCLIVDRSAPPASICGEIEERSEEGYIHYATFDVNAAQVMFLFRRERA